MTRFFLILNLLLLTPLFGEITEWQKAELEEAFNEHPLSAFSRKNVRRAKRLSGNRNLHLVVIKEDGKIWVDRKNPTYYSTLIQRLLKRLQKIQPLPPCVFLFTRSGDNATKVINKAPVLVGTNDARAEKKQILFIEECTTLPRAGGVEKQWEANHSYKQVFENRENISWEEKTPRLVWRGFLTDYLHKESVEIEGQSYSLSPRTIGHLLGLKHPNFFDVCITNFYEREVNYLYRIGLGQKIFGNTRPTQFTGHIGSYVLTPRMSISDQMAYRYQLTLDGLHATNPGYAWRLLSGCLTFKQNSPFTQWFYSGLKPWVHYIPVERNLSDLLEKVEWALHHDAEAQKIAQNAQQFAEDHLMLDNFFEHALFVLEAYAKKQQEADASI